MIAETIDHLGPVLIDSQAKPERRLMNRGVSYLARMSGKTAGYSVLAARKTGAVFTVVSRKTLRSVSGTSKAMSLLLTPTSDFIASKTRRGNRARYRKRIRQLRKEISHLQKPIGQMLAEGLVSGVSNITADQEVLRLLEAIRFKEKEINILANRLTAGEEEKKVQVVAKGRRRKEVSVEAEAVLSAEPSEVGVELRERRQAVEVKVPESGGEEVLVTEAPGSGFPVETVAEGQSPAEVEATAAAKEAADTGKVKACTEVTETVVPSEPFAVPEEDTSDLSLAEIVEQAQFTSGSEKLLFQNAVRDVQSEDLIVRESALRKLKKIKGPAVTLACIRLAGHPNEAVRTGCLDCLLQRKDARAFRAFEKAVEDSSGKVRMRALRGLYEINPLGATAFLLEALADPDAGVRRRAVICLHWARVEEATPYLIPMLDDSNVAVRKAVIGALEALRSPLAIPHLIRALDDEECLIRQCAYKALKSLTKRKIVFTPDASGDARARGKARWEAWWQREKLSFYVI